MADTQVGTDPVGDEAARREDFSAKLNELFAAAGNPSIRHVASLTERRMLATQGSAGRKVSSQRISDWKAGRNMPAKFESAVPVLLTLFTIAKRQRVTNDPRLLDLRAWKQLWFDSSSLNDEFKSDYGGRPYLGLTSYGPDDVEIFFGRSRAVEAMTGLILGVCEGRTHSSLFALVGASGAGKSSLLAAGLGPGLAASGVDVDIVAMTPTDRPLHALSTALAVDDVNSGDVTGQILGRLEPDQYCLLVVDQFEELFTMCSDALTRAEFLDALRGLTEADADCRIIVVVALRADFYARCLEYPLLEDALNHRSYALGPMRLDEVAAAISGPAKCCGLKLDAGLEELVITELCGIGTARTESYEPGALPLLSHVLDATWHAREGKRLTVAGYRNAGGIAGSIALSAERAWSVFPERQLGIAKALLLKLVTVGQDSPDARRRVTRTELLSDFNDVGGAQAVLEALVAARLVTVDFGLASLTHEIVLTAWPRLKGWIDNDRVGFLVRQRMEIDATEWVAGGRDPAMLYRGPRLEAAREHVVGDVLSRDSAAFLAASLAYHREMHRRVLVVRSLFALLGVIVLVLGLVATVQSRVATRQRNDAIFAGLLARADGLRDVDPALSAQLDVVANEIRPGNVRAFSRILATQDLPLPTPLEGHVGAVYSLAFRPDGKLLASVGKDGTVRLWDIANRIDPRPVGDPLRVSAGFLAATAFSPDGTVLAAAGADSRIRLWDVRDPTSPKALGSGTISGTGTVYSIAFAPSGRVLAASNDDHSVTLWDLSNLHDPQVLGSPLVRQRGPITSLAFSADGRLLATASDDMTVQLWDTSDTWNVVPEGPPLGGFTDVVHSVAFSNDNTMLAAGSGGGTVQLWNIAEPANPLPLTQTAVSQSGTIWSVAFGNDSRTLTTASSDGEVKRWSLRDPAHPTQLGPSLAGNNGGVLAMAVSPDGRTVATAGGEGTVRLWSMPSSVLADFGARAVTEPVFSADGDRLAAASVDGTIQLWDTTIPSQPRRLAEIHRPNRITSLALSPDGTTIAVEDRETAVVELLDVADATTPNTLSTIQMRTRYSDVLAFSPNSRFLIAGADDHSLQLFDIADRAHPVPFGHPIQVSQKWVTSATFDSTGDTIATTATDGLAKLWGMADPARIRQLGPDLAGHQGSVNSAAFSPDGRTLITGGGDQTVRVWDIADPLHAHELGPPLKDFAATVDSLAFDPKGATFVSGSIDKAVRLWNVRDRGNPVALGDSIALPTGNWLLAFDPVADYITALGEDGALRLWDLNPGHAVTRICELTNRAMNPIVWSDYLPGVPYRAPCGSDR